MKRSVDEEIKLGVVSGLFWAVVAVTVYSIFWTTITVRNTLYDNWKPVISDVSILEVDLRPQVMFVDIEFTKNRDCDFVTVQTFLGKREGRAAAISNEFSREVGTRPDKTTFVIEDWKIFTNEPFVNIYADAIHKCGNRTVRTPFIH